MVMGGHHGGSNSRINTDGWIKVGGGEGNGDGRPNGRGEAKPENMRKELAELIYKSGDFLCDE